VPAPDRPIVDLHDARGGAFLLLPAALAPGVAR
jgi:hypothetical protein